jgi:hypothetical protein
MRDLRGRGGAGQGHGRPECVHTIHRVDLPDAAALKSGSGVHPVQVSVRRPTLARNTPTGCCKVVVMRMWCRHAPAPHDVQQPIAGATKASLVAHT